jgi:hypothetical protein
MPLSSYLPSAQFTLVVFSIALAGGLVLVSDYLASPPKDSGEIVAGENLSGVEPMDWQLALQEIQGDSALAEPIDPAVFQSLKKNAVASTLTGTVGRSILLNLSEAKSQGLGSDFPTQERLVADAAAQAAITRGTPIYQNSDLILVEETEESLKSYGNALMRALTMYPKTAMSETLLAVGQAVDTGKISALTPLAAIEAEHRALTANIKTLPVPVTLAPIHLQILNNFARITSLYPDLKVSLSDPLRGIGALNLYQSLIGETERLLTSTARIFNENGILFASDEPGNIWGLLLTVDDEL